MLRFISVMVLLALSGPLPTRATTPLAWTVDDLLLDERAAGWTLSPDGRLAAWTKSLVEKNNGEEIRVSQLWLTRLTDNSSLPLTRGIDSVSSPVFSPDGGTIAFIFRRPRPGVKDQEAAKGQVWAIRTAGGEPFPVTRLERPVRAFGWIDNQTLVVAAQEAPAWRERDLEERKDTTLVVEDAEHEPPVRLFRVAVEGGDARPLTANRDWIDALAVAPDGRRAVVRAQQSLSYEFDERIPPHTFLVDLSTGESTRLLMGTRLVPEDTAWAPDGRGFYFVNRFSSHPLYRSASVRQLWYHDLSSGRSERVDESWERGLGGGIAPVSGGVVALLADGVRHRPALFRRGGSGWDRRDLGGEHVGGMVSLVASRDGRTIIYEYSTATVPAQWFAASLEGSRCDIPRALTALNPSYAGKPTGRVDVFRYLGAQNDEVEAILHYPLPYDPGTKYPLILDIHGGPAATDFDHWSQSWASPLLLWRQRGAFVLQVNYHGSAGYGLDWVESIGQGRYYELEVPDLERGVDTLIAAGLVDPARLATCGWSNGGILSAELITRTSRFRAASIGAADVEWFSDWANVDFGAAFNNYYFGGPPWEIPQVYLQKSPFFRLAQVTTPTIVFTGTEDRSVPPQQSWSLFRALQQLGRTDVRLVLFPGEPHGLRQIPHQRRKVEEELAWLDRHLFQAGRPANPALKRGSLLEGLLQKASVAHDGERLGTGVDGVLLPETVAFRGLEVSRFEVTRAQFAAFQPTPAVPPGKDNLPAIVTLEQAQAYAAWLAERTGRPFRLPTETEAESMACGHSGNTLDRWAGYEINLDDAARLAQPLAKLGVEALLLPVGSLPGSGDDPVFDLDGNAAEWALRAGGGGAPLGPSADRPASPAPPSAAPSVLTGIRLVVGPPPSVTIRSSESRP